MADKAVFTCVTADRDALRAPATIEDGVDYIVYSDNPDFRPVRPWQVRPVTVRQRNARVTSRWYKILPHRHLPEYRTSLWIDATLNVSKPIRSWMDDLGGRCDLALFAHPERDCLYEEASAVLRFGIEHRGIVDLQTAFYRSQGYPAHGGLTENSVIFRRHHDRRIVAVMEDWWRQIELFSDRDQLSANYTFWKHGLAYERLSGCVAQNQWFRYEPHRGYGPALCTRPPHDEIAWLRSAAIELSRERSEVERLTETIKALHASTSWRVTAPIRRLILGIEAVKRGLSRNAQPVLRRLR